MAGLRRREAFPHQTGPIEAVETHISTVLLAGEFAYKLKKPVNLGFADFSTLELRRHFCQEEIRLNRRVAPQLYLDVVAITGTLRQPRVGGDAGPGGAIEYAVRMRRFASQARLDRLAQAGQLTAVHIDRLAATVAGLHARAERAPSDRGYGSAEEIGRWALGNLADLRAGCVPGPMRDGIDHLQAFTERELARRGAVIATRQADGHVRECHGDLHLGNLVLLAGAPLPFDCIEFNDRLRFIDVINDVAFTFMDLIEHDLAGFAWRLIGAYLEHTGDYGAVAMLGFYTVYRALVRAKIAQIRLRQAGERARAAAQGEDPATPARYVDVAIRQADAGAARLIVTCGPAGSGKTTVSQLVLEQIGAVRVRSDIERKRLFGVEPATHPAEAVDAGLYAADATRRTYEHLTDAARAILDGGVTAIVDATFLRQRDRQQFSDLAQQAGVPFSIVACEAPAATLRERVQRRLEQGSDPSDATLQVLEHQLEAYEPLTPDERAVTIRIDTDTDQDSLRRRATETARGLGRSGDAAMKQRTQINIGYIIFAFVGVLMLQNAWMQYRAIEPLAYSDFLAQLKAGNVQDIAIASNVIRGTLKKPLPGGRKQFLTTRVDPELAKDLDTYGVKFTGVIENTFFKDLLGWIVPALVFVGIWFFLVRRLQERVGTGLLSIGKSKAKVYVETDVKATFEDVAGVDEAKEELKEVVGFLKDPTRYGRLGARLPKGVLLVGPPGTGKTLLARAVAGEAGVPFFSINGSEFVEMFVGVGAARVRDLFEEARKQAPAIIFIDEIDALGRARGAYGIGGHDEKEQTLNQLLAELDGFDPKSGLVLIAATNRPEILDPALLRAGRFDRQVLVDRPDRSGRVAILRVHVKKVALAPGVDLDQIAALTPGFSGADLANLVNEAALQATRSNHPQVELDDFTVAIERIVAGLEKRSRVLSANERTVVAHHEMGHALVATALPGQDPVQKISIIPRGIGALGYTLQRPIEDRYLMTRTELENRMATLLGGRAAEQLIFGELSTGAADDLAKATQIARSIVARYGMDATLGLIVYEQERTAFLAPNGMDVAPRNYSEQTAREIDVAARNLLEAAFAKSIRILTERRAALERGAQRLLQKETLTDPELGEILAGPEQRAAA